MCAGAAVLVLVPALACSEDAPSGDPSVSTATSAVIRRPGKPDVTLAKPLGPAPPLAFARHGETSAIFLGDRVVRTGRDGAVAEEVRYTTTAFGVELAPARKGTAAAVVTVELGKQKPHTQLMWVDAKGVRTLHEADTSQPLVGVVDDGVVIREGTGVSPLSLVGWDKSVARLGLSASDAVVVPRTSLLVFRAERTSPLRAADVGTAKEVTVTGLPAGASFSQVAASPTDSEIAIVTGTPEAGEVWVIAARDGTLRARRVGGVAAGEVLAGFSDDGKWLYTVRGTTTSAVRLADGSTRSVTIAADETPLGWSRTVLTLETLRR